MEKKKRKYIDTKEELRDMSSAKGINHPKIIDDWDKTRFEQLINDAVLGVPSKQQDC